MELYGTFLQFLALTKLATAPSPMSARELAEQFNELDENTDTLTVRIRAALQRAEDRGLASSEFLPVHGHIFAHFYQVTPNFYEQIKDYGLDDGKRPPHDGRHSGFAADTAPQDAGSPPTATGETPARE